MNGANRYTTRNLAETLDAQGRKARWLASEVGVSESLISKIGKGIRLADEPLAERIAKTLGVPFSMLFELHERSESLSSLERVA
jgi:transcriptional regulator with XRE-family HTH domain